MKLKKIKHALLLIAFFFFFDLGTVAVSALAAMPVSSGSATDSGPLDQGAADSAREITRAAQPVPDQPALSRWTKPVPHVFFHPLVSKPEIAFREGKWRNHVYEWFVTVTEFRRFLDSLYQRGYVLVDVFEIMSRADDGTWSVQAFDVPQGKTPLLLSIDDLNYYAEMRWNGTASRLEVDEAGQLRTRSFASSQVRVDEATGDTVAYDNEIPLILEDFIRMHPDFSWHGARGIVALTGKRGLFGWPTHDTASPQYPMAVKGAKAVADWLLAQGWHFAGHSYWHKHRSTEAAADFDKAERRWIAETKDILGSTPLYIFPFGEPLLENEGKRKTLRDLGYGIFFTVEAVAVQSVQHGLPVLGRVPIDGRALDGKFGVLSKFCDRTAVRDGVRPPRPAGL